MLLGNYSVLNKNCMRATTGTVKFNTRSNWNTSGLLRGVQFQLGQTTAFRLFGRPDGYYPPVTWMLPQVAGRLSVANGLMVGSGDLTGQIAAGVYIGSTITGSGDLTADISALASLISSITSSGTITLASANMLAIISANLNGNGTLSGAAILAANMASNTSGGGDLNGDISGALFMDAAISGNAATDFDGSLAGILAAALTGVGITVADINGVWGMESDIEGTGELSSSIAAKANAAANLTGHGDISDAEANAMANISCSIKSFGDLTPEGLAAAVWQALGSQFQGAGTMGLLLNSAGSGGIDPALVAKIVELWQLQGLDVDNPMTVTPTTRTTGTIDLEITGDGVTTTTVTRT
jgi:hypothetical protein